MDPSDARLQVLHDKEEIETLLMNYARGVDRRDWELVRSCYHDDALDDHGSYQGDVDGFIRWVSERHATIEQSMHFLGNILLEIEGDVAYGETYLTTYQHETRPGQPTRYSHAGCRYVDRFERRDGGPWKFAVRHVILEFVHQSEQPSGQDFNGAREVARRSRDDLVYRAWA